VIEVQVARLMIDENTNSPVVVLKETDGDRVLPIWIGATEANAIAMGLSGKRFQRPLTHDLLSTVIRGLHGNVVKILISDLKDNTFYATILLQGERELVTVDARPSDSIAVALRENAPIFVAEQLLDDQGGRVGPFQTTKPSAEERAAELRRHLEGMSPEDFGRFQL
jgi:bifunctional DNase/RNase